jgi:hypothetical protein
MGEGIPAIIVPGHQVASGQNNNPRFPGGTLRMQAPHFLALGLDLSRYHQGTINVSIAPWRYRVVRPRHTFRDVQWHPTEPAEDFSFCNVAFFVGEAESIRGLVYYPHPDTKPAHFQKPDVLELILPWIDGITYGMKVTLVVPREEMEFDT